MKFESAGFNSKKQPEKTLLEKMRSIPKGIKTTVLAGALSLSSLDSQATQDTTVVDTKNPEKTQTYQQPSQENEKMASFEAIQKETENDFTLNISNAFETDSALVKPESAKFLEMELQKFWSKLTPENLDEFLSHPIVVYSSCDEDRTNTYKGGNAELAQLRAEQGEKIVEQSLNTFDFSSKGFSAEDIEKIKNVDIVYNIPQYGGYEKGVTPLTKIVNPETGVFFADEELDAMTSEKREDLKQKARWVKIEVEGVKGLEEEKKETTPYEDKFKIIFKLLNDYDDLSLLVDNSSSMNNSQELLRKTMKEGLVEKPVFYAPFSQRVGEMVNFDDETAVRSSTEKLPKDNKEYGLDAALAISESLEPDKKHAIVVITDEDLQGITKRKLEAVRAKDNISVYFYVLNDVEQNYRMVSLEEIETLFDAKYQQRKKKLEKRTMTENLYDKELNDEPIMLYLSNILY